MFGFATFQVSRTGGNDNGKRQINAVNLFLNGGSGNWQEVVQNVQLDRRAKIARGAPNNPIDRLFTMP